MKKIFLMLTMFIGLAVSANAQTALVDNGTLKDNWYVGAGVGTNVWNDATSWTLFNSKSMVSDGKTNSWWRTQPIHVNVLVGKMFNPYLGAEVDYTAAFNLRGGNSFLDGHTLTGSAVVNLTNLVAGYNGTRRTFEVEAVGGAGWMHNFNKKLTNGVATDPNAFAFRGGLRGNLNLTSDLALTATVDYVLLPKNVGDAAFTKHGMNAGLGLKWRIPTKRGNFKKYQLYDYDEVSNLTAKINSLEADKAQLEKANADLSKANADLSETIKKLTEEGAKVVVETKTIGKVLFEKGKSDVTPAKVSDVLTALKDSKGTIVLTGNASPEGTEKFNKKVAEARAEAVKKALVDSGVDASRIVVKNDYENQRSVVITVE